MELQLQRYHTEYNWIGMHIQYLDRMNVMGLYFVLCSARHNETDLTPPIGIGELAEVLGVTERTVRRRLDMLESIGAISRVRGQGKHRYQIKTRPPAGVLIMRPIGADPEEDDEPRTTKRKRERRTPLGGTDIVEPEPLPRRKPRNTARSLCTYFEDHVIHKRMLPRYHLGRPALEHQLKRMLEEWDGDHIRRMIRHFSEDLKTRPLREDQEAWKLFVAKSRELARATITRPQSEVDYSAETALDPLLLEDDDDARTGT